jgi:hypothetical protein
MSTYEDTDARELDMFNASRVEPVALKTDLFELCGTLKGGGLLHESYADSAEAIRIGKKFCESFEVLDSDGFQIYNEFPRTRWV